MEPAYEPLLPGVALAGYRSFAEWQEILLPTKVTVLAGINNSGKSNVLRFLQHVLPALKNRIGHQARQRDTPTLSELDTPRGFSTASDFEIGLPVHFGEVSNEAPEEIVRRAANARRSGSYSRAVMQLLSPVEPIFWARYNSDHNGNLVPSSHLVAAAMKRWPQWDTSYENVVGTNHNDPGNARGAMTKLLESIALPNIPLVSTIDGSRRIEAGRDGTSDPDWSSGRGIIEALFKLQSPTYSDWDASNANWRGINQFTQTVLGDPDAHLAIPHDRSTIQVVTKDRVLPLSSLGSGVEQVIILAAAATVVSKHLVCIEEPETNLHPLLQKKLLRYLTKETDNQYVIATHSSHFLDDAHATAYNVRLTETGTKLALARRPHELVQICNDLGYRPSDLQQANCVIWVEGPSDRTYVRRWLELVDPDLAEGIDYSVMFYGGSLLSHLSTSEDALNDFISLRSLNHSSTILIDSDRTGSDKQINATKQRIQNEYLKDAPAPGSVWITAGYTVENYIPEEILHEAIHEVHPNATLRPGGMWTNPLPQRKGETAFDKVAIAQAAVQLLEQTHLDVLDLQDQVETLRAFIRASNGHSTAPDSGA